MNSIRRKHTLLHPAPTQWPIRTAGVSIESQPSDRISIWRRAVMHQDGKAERGELAARSNGILMMNSRHVPAERSTHPFRVSLVLEIYHWVANKTKTDQQCAESSFPLVHTCGTFNNGQKSLFRMENGSRLLSIRPVPMAWFRTATISWQSRRRSGNGRSPTHWSY